jgi:hypothetical protein
MVRDGGPWTGPGVLASWGPLDWAPNLPTSHPLINENDGLGYSCLGTVGTSPTF